MTRPRGALSVGIMLLLATLVLGCDDDDGNCFFSDCQTDADCPGNWECKVVFFNRVCAAPGATVCDLGTIGSYASVFDEGEIVGPVTALEDEPEPSSPASPASESQPPATSPPSP